MRRQQQRQLHRPQRHVRTLRPRGRPRPDVVQDPQHHVQGIGRRQHRRLQRRPRGPRHQHLRITPRQHPAPVERIGQHLVLGRAEPHDEVAGQRDPVHRGPRPPRHLHPQHRQQNGQPPPPYHHVVQQRRFEPLIVRGRAAKPVPLPEQVPQRDRPGPRPAGPERQLSRQPVQLHLHRVHPHLVQLPVRLGSHQQAQQGQVGPLGPRLLGEPSAQLGGTLGRWGVGGTHSRLVPFHGDRYRWRRRSLTVIDSGGRRGAR